MQSLRQLRRVLLAVLVGANVLVLLVAADSLYLSRGHSEERAQALTRNIARALDASISGSIDRVDLVLHAVVDELERQTAQGGIDESAMNEFLIRQAGRVPEIESVRVARADGLVILGGGLVKSEHASWADRDYFELLRDNPQGGLMISKPLMGHVAKQYIIGFTRRYNDPDGRFGGVVAAPMALDQFSRILSQYDLGPNGAIILRDADAGLIARVPPIPGRPAGQVGNSDVSGEFRKWFHSGVRTATYFTATDADGYQGMSTLHRLEDRAMVVVASMAQRDYLADWNHDLYRTVAIAGSFVLVSLLLGSFLQRSLRQTEKDRLRLESQLAEISVLQERLQDQAVRDPLTGLYNRRYLDDALARELSRAKREGCPLALIMLDLDHFKDINDTYGHAAGDKVLKIVSDLLTRGARESDMIFRYGGEEFLIALPRVSPEQALERMDAWRHELCETSISFGDFTFRVTLSAGIAAYPRHGADADTLLARSDAALYCAKQAGRNRVACFEADS